MRFGLPELFALEAGEVAVHHVLMGREDQRVAGVQNDAFLDLVVGDEGREVAVQVRREAEDEDDVRLLRVPGIVQTDRVRVHVDVQFLVQFSNGRDFPRLPPVDEPAGEGEPSLSVFVVPAHTEQAVPVRDQEYGCRERIPVFRVAAPGANERPRVALWHQVCAARAVLCVQERVSVFHPLHLVSARSGGTGKIGENRSLVNRPSPLFGWRFRMPPLWPTSLSTPIRSSSLPSPTGRGR